jgi:hypothetical protein
MWLRLFGPESSLSELREYLKVKFYWSYIFELKLYLNDNACGVTGKSF